MIKCPYCGSVLIYSEPLNQVFIYEDCKKIFEQQYDDFGDDE